MTTEEALLALDWIRTRLSDAQERVAAAEEKGLSLKPFYKLEAENTKLREELEEARAEREHLREQLLVSLQYEKELRAAQRTPTPGVVSEEAERAFHDAFNKAFLASTAKDAVHAGLTAAAPFMGQQRVISEEEFLAGVGAIADLSTTALWKLKEMAHGFCRRADITITPTKPAAEGEGS